jgi:hypothetical protein
VTLKAYRANNGFFAKYDIQNSAKNQGQVPTFSGVGAHTQNGIAERYICTLTESAHTMLLHSMAIWPKQIITSFWTFAMTYAVHIHNASPLDCGLTP